jgi:hypothetical protein
VSRSATPPAAAGKPRKSPLRLAAVEQPSFPSAASRDGRLSPQQLRAMMISEFEQWLRSRTNQEKRPFHEETVVAYAKAARAADCRQGLVLRLGRADRERSSSAAKLKSRARPGLRHTGRSWRHRPGR